MENRKKIKSLTKTSSKKRTLLSTFSLLLSAKRGSLLIEILIVVSILAVVLSLGAQSSYVSLVANKSAGEKDVAMGIATETLEAVRSASDEKWQNLYDLTKSTQHYYPNQSALGKWVISNTGDETIVINGIAYSRYFVVKNVCRDNSSRSITSITDSDGSLTTCSSGSLDPSTEKITTTVSWQNADPVIIDEYLLRWRNKICDNANWVGGKTYPSDPLASCPSNPTTYYNDDGNIDNTGGVIKILGG